MARKDIVVIGASAGGVEALKVVVSGLAPRLEAALFIVLHTRPDGRSVLPEVLQRHCHLPISYPSDGQSIEMGHVYVARPDHHLTIEDDRIRLTRGPKENRTRPAVDPLFRSAAYAFNTRVIGVVLTGTLDDGTAGLWFIKRRGGTAVVQDPHDAEQPSMPRSALKYVTADHVASLQAIGPLLNRLTQEPAAATSEPASEELKMETRIAQETEDETRSVLDLGSLTPFTCPDCHGVLSQLKGGGIPRFRCHTGHAYSIESLLAEVTRTVEDSLWSAIRSIEESVLLLKSAAGHVRERGQPASLADELEQAAHEAARRADMVRVVVTSEPGAEEVAMAGS